ncbi:TIR domain-containing protein [Capnocytophaga canis]|uniref:TIR domain-containing protein n=1 Tax=Capnocytophaga canis TaxID=1848903 RepID=UPI0037D6FF98
MKTLNLFISYNHTDESLIGNFIKHILPLEHEGMIEVWYDRKLEGGDDLQKKIDEKIEKTDVACLMISHNFFSSNACMEEKDKFLNLREKKGIKVIPIILSPCNWLKYDKLSKLLAVPTDGKPITSFSEPNDGWLDAVKLIEKACSTIVEIKKLKVKGEFKNFLENTDLLAKSHSGKETLLLDDVFVFPKLKYYDDKEKSHKFDSETFKTEILRYGKIIIAGENQSGKTTLCKELFKIFRELNLIPVYISDDNRYLGNPLNKIEKAFLEQYENVDFEKYNNEKIVPIIDNFHLAKYKEKYIEQYKNFPNQVLIVDDIFGLNFSNQTLIQEYNKFKIREFTALERNELIQKWIKIKENDKIETNSNYLQQSIDEKTEVIENSLGIAFGKGIMPSYPFFILTLLSAQETQKPLDAEITSQGYCYQALIYLYLRKEGVKNDQIDIYVNFLTELAFWIYDKKNNGLNNEEFDQFVRYYTSRFNLPIPIQEIVKKLSKVNICKFDSCNQYNFCYGYLYYFFTAKYLSEHIEDRKKVINNIISNLHKDENAYITIFIAHHTKSDYILDELLLNSEMLFDKYTPATLTTEQLLFFDKHQEQIVKAILPTYEHNVDAERKKLLTNKSISEDSQQEKTEIYNAEIEEQESELIRNLRLSIKTVEVMGLVIKNRSGSLELDRLKYIFEQGVNVHLRIVTFALELIQNEQSEQMMVDFLTERINGIINDSSLNNKKLNIDNIKKLAKEIYWNLNFGLLHGLITKLIHSLGSSNLLNIAQQVNDKIDSPAVFIVNHGIKMWYNKNIKIDEIKKRVENKDFSLTAKKLMQHKIVEHCLLHKIDYKKLEEIEKKLHIPSSKILIKGSKQ